MPNFLNEPNKPISEKSDNLYEEAKDLAQKGTKEIKQSSQDWICYVKEHPIQSIFFSLIGNFALRGFIKK